MSTDILTKKIKEDNSFNCPTLPFALTKWGFLRQIGEHITPFKYDLNYKLHQATTSKMVGIRMGWLAAHIAHEDLTNFNVVDIGAGNGMFVEETKAIFKRVVPYDLAGDSISDQELYSTSWDLICLTDVLEHFDDIDSLFNISFRYALISFPETPRGYDLTSWRHMKPGEHLWLLNAESFRAWVISHGCQIIASGCPEDMLRRRWDKDKVNISTFLIHR